MSFSVAIVGRPNVGKSTLFNRLAGQRLALVDDTPGVTRDRRPAEAKLVDLTFRIIDTAGLEESGPDTLQGRMRAQTEAAIDEADMALFVVDAKSGLTPLDGTLAELLRRYGKPVVLVANKAEARGAEAGLYDAYTLGLGEPCPISAEHGEGMLDLRDAIVAALGGEDALVAVADEAASDVDVRDGAGEDATQPVAGDGVAGSAEDAEEPESVDDPEKPMRIAVVGRPNAGKSTLINRMLGEERLLTGPEAGITRDSIAVDLAWQGRAIRLFDTAGLRRKARVQEKLEKLSVADALRAIRFAEVVVVVLDATMPFERQDLQIVDLVVREGRAAVIVFNKWDMVDDRQAMLSDLRERTERLLPQVRGIRAVPISGLTGDGLGRMMKAVSETHAVWNRRISTAKLNRWLEEAQTRHPPPAVSGRRINLKYMTQIKARPPGFVLSTSRPEALPAAYTRYLVNGLRTAFDLPGVPIRLSLRKGDNPYADRKKRKTR
ncbi:ribosome biogenesis GTPase Der [Pararhizobium mangrovi]|uniref:GTPase Der n=1 Tax=Pararhizobium mangrovi TaxID=2590452 RepID=A0A506TXL7_9HYPH|nr:ribosome biogenesis GTPase Der [Pararhizobium mangrovi]TPW25918.1 ribosome biogenesis GTPase Der [Pararhizobium mangrovi]